MSNGSYISTSLNKDFASVLEIIQYHRSLAVRTINHASILTAWHVGAYVSNRIKNAQWGAKVVQQLAEYIHTQDPTLKGWSRRTIYKMVQFYDVYSSAQFVERANSLRLLSAPDECVPPAVTPIHNTEIVPFRTAQIGEGQIVPFQMAQLPKLLTRTGWTNHQIILQCCTTTKLPISSYGSYLSTTYSYKLSAGGIIFSLFTYPLIALTHTFTSAIVINIIAIVITSTVIVVRFYNYFQIKKLKTVESSSADIEEEEEETYNIVSNLKNSPISNATSSQIDDSFFVDDEEVEMLEQEMREAAKNLDFERAMELRDIIFELESE